MINVSTLLYILNLWTTCLKTEIGFKPNTLHEYQVFLNKENLVDFHDPNS
jgi:hypothetical protein